MISAPAAAASRISVSRFGSDTPVVYRLTCCRFSPAFSASALTVGIPFSRAMASRAAMICLDFIFFFDSIPARREPDGALRHGAMKLSVVEQNALNQG